MIIWTLQKAAILNHIQQSGFYQPDFSMSPFLWDKPELAKPYARVLQAFNRHNQTSLPGLIFGFTASDNRCIYDLPTAEDFCRHIAPRMDAIRSLWRNLTERQNCVLMQLEYPDNINPVFIDINDFQFLMPPCIPSPPYTPEDEGRLYDLIGIGRIAPSVYPSGIIQAHLPWITHENILACFEPPTLE